MKNGVPVVLPVGRCGNATLTTFTAHYSTHKKENQIEAAKNRAKKRITQNAHTQTKQQGLVTLSTELQSTALILNYLHVAVSKV